MIHDTRRITPQAIFSPEWPEGWVAKSSGMAWMTTVRPMTSATRKRPVLAIRNARPSQASSGGRSPVWQGWGQPARSRCPPVSAKPSPPQSRPSWMWKPKTRHLQGSAYRGSPLMSAAT